MASDVVVAVIGEEATVKKFYPEKRGSVWNLKTKPSADYRRAQYSGVLYRRPGCGIDA